MKKSILDFENILKRFLSEKDSAIIDLSDNNSVYRKSFFDIIPSHVVEEVFDGCPEGEVLHKKYLEIIDGTKKQKSVDDGNLCKLVDEYLLSNIEIMGDEDSDAIDCIRSADKVEIAKNSKNFNNGDNILHKYVYGAVSEFLLNSLPDNDAVWLLYDWSLEKTRWITVTAYLLEEYMESDLTKKDLFKPGFELWLSGNSDSYWVQSNDITNKKIFCKSKSSGYTPTASDL